MSCVDDYEAIRRRAEEIRAEQNLALTGTSASVVFTGVPTGGSSATISVYDLPPYTPTDIDYCY